MKPRIAILFSALLVAGCSWNALHSKPSIAPVHVAFTDYKKPHRGKYLLLVSGVGLDQKIKVDGKVCTSHDFPLLMSNSFDESVKKTLANILENIEIVSTPQTQKQIRAAKARALITIKDEGQAGHLLVNPGFLTKDSKVKLQVSAHVQVFKAQGGVFEEHMSSVDTASLSIGRCLDAHKTVSAAASKTLKQLVEQIGSSVSRSLSSKK